MTTAAQINFSGGELAPALHARADLTKYATGLRTMRNFALARSGGAHNRLGTVFVAETAQSAVECRLIPFVFDLTQSYCLEFGDHSFRVHRLGVQLPFQSGAGSAVAITNVAAGASTVVTATAHGFGFTVLADGTPLAGATSTYGNNFEVQVSGIVGMTELNGRNFKIDTITANTFRLLNMDGSALDSSGYGAYVSGGSVARVFEQETPYVESDLQDLQFTQNADVMTIVHRLHPPRELARLGHTSWTLTDITFAPTQARPTGLDGALGPAGLRTFKYKVTAVSNETGEESLAGLHLVGQNVTGATQANPAVITVVAHTYDSGDGIRLSGLGGMTELNDRDFAVTRIDANTFSLDNEDSTTHTAYTAGGTSRRTFVRLPNAGVPSDTNPHTLSWLPTAGAREYNIYKAQSGIYGFLGSATGTSFEDIGLNPDVGDTPPESRNPFDRASRYPSAVGYAQQRLVFANTIDNPETVWMSRTGRYHNFTISFPIKDDDAIEFTLVGRTINPIRHLLEIGRLILLTNSGEWAIEGSAAGVITPDEINPRQYGYSGASVLRPVPIDSGIVYVDERGATLRDLRFDVAADGYGSSDLTLFASHLFDDRGVRDLAYWRWRQNLLLAVMTDGALLGLTFLRDQQVAAWSRHDFTNGAAEQVAVVPQSGDDAVYLVIRRTIGGATVRYLEHIPPQEDSVHFMDSVLSRDGTNADPAHTMTWTPPVGGYGTIISSQAFFSASDVGNAIHLNGPAGDVLRLTITGYVSPTSVEALPHRTTPAWALAATASWGHAVDTIGGLWHLEGQEVSVLADDFVAANPNNGAYGTPLTVTGGAVTLSRPYVAIAAGLPITSDLETLDLEVVDAETLSDKRRIVSKVSLRVLQSRGIFAGAEAPSSDDSQTELYEYKIRELEEYDEPTAPKTGVIDVAIQSDWRSNGRVFVRQTDPVAVHVLAAYPSGFIVAGRS